MWVGCFEELVFAVSSDAVFTMQGMQGSTGSRWAVHDVVGGKGRSQYIGPALKKFSFDVVLDAGYGMDPRAELEKMQQMAEEGRVGYLIVGSAPIGMCRYKLTDVSDEWETVVSGGKLVRCTVNLSMEEYV